MDTNDTEIEAKRMKFLRVSRYVQTDKSKINK